MAYLRHSLSILAGLLSALPMMALSVGGLRTQYLTNPIGIDEATPTFSWRLSSDKRGVVQATYNITVATDAALSQVAWQSGQIESAESANVRADGFTPAPSTRYYWAVTVTDNKGNVATSTTPAYFETGLMGTGWDGAQWITLAQPGSTATSAGSESIDPSTVRNYTVEADFEIERVAAGIIWGATDHNNYYMWQFNIEKSPTKFRPHQWSGGNAACLAEKDVELVANKIYHMRVDVSDGGTMARTYLNNVFIDERAGEYTYGRIGIRAAQGENNTRTYERAYYDNYVARNTDTGDVLFSEDFDNPGAIAMSGGDAIDGRLRVGAYSDEYVWAIDDSSIDPNLHYVVEADMTLIKDNAAIIFGRTGSVNYHMWAINTVNHANPCVRRHVYAGSSTPIWSDTEFTAFTKAALLGHEHHLKIEVQGNQITTSIDGQVVDTFKDTSGSPTAGPLPATRPTAGLTQP